MHKVFLYSLLLLLGLIGSQWLPNVVGAQYATIEATVRILTMTALSFIMIRVGYEFDIDKSNLGQYGWDYLVAFTAASLPWIFVTLYFVFVLLPAELWTNLEAWKETLLAGRFAAPTSAGVLFSMLAAAGLEATWVYRKARILAIFDDLDTVLLMIPLKMLMVGVAWQLGLIIVVIMVMLAVAFIFLHRIRIPVTWPWVTTYAIAITAASEAIYQGSKLIDESVPIHIEVLMPAFVLGCTMAYPKRDAHKDAMAFFTEHCGHEVINTPPEQKTSTFIAAAFIFLVGLSMPTIFNEDAMMVPGVAGNPIIELSQHIMPVPGAEGGASGINGAKSVGRITATQLMLAWDLIALHVLLITLISNLGKMFPAFCYRREAHWRERLAVAIGMWPRGEVGAGVLVISLAYGIGGTIVAVAMLSLALNLMLTGLFIFIVKRLTLPVANHNRINQALQSSPGID